LIRLIYTYGMKKKVKVFGFVLLMFFISGCSSDNKKESSELVEYNSCLQSETDKLLDETSSNLDYARGEALKVCEPLKPATTP
jgi:hypothetical protein